MDWIHQKIRLLTNKIRDMSSNNKKSTEGLEPKSTPHIIHSYDKLEHTPNVDILEATAKRLCKVESLLIKVEDDRAGSVPGFFHLPPDFVQPEPGSWRTAAVLLSGAGGGVVGPSSIYLSMGDKLASLSTAIPTLRLDYRYPAQNKYCVRDVLASMDFLEQTYGLSRFVLIGWSFGGAPVFTVGGSDPRVVGCGTVASQTAHTKGILNLAPKPLLLLHGTCDKTLGASCSESLYSGYGSKGSRTMKLFEGDDHALSKNAETAEEMLCSFIAECAGIEIDGQEREAIIEQKLVEENDRIELMKRGGDLRGDEHVG
jgi:hypothetical protein